jgi:hypothetical protein
MHIFMRSFSYISEFKTILKIIYEALIRLSWITKKEEIESASRPLCGFWSLNDKMIKELMSFAKCKTWNMSCGYVEAIHSSRHVLWPICLHILNVIKTRRISSNDKEENDLMMYATCLLLSQNIFKTWGHILLHQHFKDYQHKLIEDTKSCVDHDGDWIRIKKGLAVMNHTSEKSKWKTWRWGFGCDGEGQVNCWVQDINHAIKAYNALSVDICWIKKSRRQVQEETSWLHKSK